MRFTWLLFAVIVFLAGCSIGINTTIKKKFPPLDSLQEVRVLDIAQPFPQEAVEVGTVRIYGRATIKCDSATVFGAAKNEARKAGGNVLKITRHMYPNEMSSCHEITGVILRVDNFNDSVFAAKPAQKPTLPKPDEKSWRLALNAGYSWQTAKIPGNINSFEKSYLEELKSGTHYGAEFNYFYREQSAVSIQVNMFKSSYSTYATATYPNGSSVSGILSDDISTLYIAPGMTWRLLSSTKMNAFLLGFTLGYMHYKDESQFISPVTISGSTLGLSYDLGYDIGLSKSMALGLGFSWKLGTLSSIEVNQNGKSQTMKLDNDSRVGIGHLDFSLGLRFR